RGNRAGRRHVSPPLLRHHRDARRRAPGALAGAGGAGPDRRILADDRRLDERADLALRLHQPRSGLRRRRREREGSTRPHYDWAVWRPTGPAGDGQLWRHGDLSSRLAASGLDRCTPTPPLDRVGALTCAARRHALRAIVPTGADYPPSLDDPP